MEKIQTMKTDLEKWSKYLKAIQCNQDKFVKKYQALYNVNEEEATTFYHECDIALSIRKQEEEEERQRKKQEEEHLFRQKLMPLILKFVAEKWKKDALVDFIKCTDLETITELLPDFNEESVNNFIQYVIQPGKAFHCFLTFVAALCHLLNHQV